MTKAVSLTIMGCGTSTGVPVPSCPCPVCNSRESKNNRLRCAALVKTPCGKTIVIDTGPDFRQQVLRYDIRQIDAVLFTHAHADHILGFDDLRSFNFTMKQAVQCYASDATFSSIKGVFQYIFDPDPSYQGGMLTSVSLHTIQHGSSFSIGDTSIEPFSLYHGDMEITGYKIGTIAYATDCNFIPDASKELLRGIDHLVLDGLRHRAHPTHFTIAQAIATASDLDVTHTYLTHMSHDICYHEESTKLPEGVSLCYDGLTIEAQLT